MEKEKDTAALLKQVRELKQQVQVTNATLEAIKNEKIDALIVPRKDKLKIFTEITADRNYRILIDKMHEGVISVNKEGIILYSNSYFAKMVHLNLKKVIGKNITSFIEKTSEEHFTAIFNRGWEHPVKEEIDIIAGDTTIIPVLISLNTLTLDGEIVLSIIFTDLTILHENQKKLKERTKQLEKKNVQLEVALKEVNYQNAERIKRSAELAAANLEIFIQSKESAKRDTELTEVTSVAKELEELNVHKESVLATLSHDLRGPLAGIISLSEHLKERFETMEKHKIKETLELLYTASTNELSMLDSLVEWARVKYATEIFAPVNIALSKDVKVVFETLKENASEKGLQLFNEVKKDVMVYADEKMLLSILQNILSNAIKSTLSGGKITVSAIKKDNKVITTVTDTGIGMSKEQLDKLFHPQLKELSKEREENKGAGIGLLLVKGFIEKNGGEIWVDSKEEEGSSFHFSLPAYKAQDITSN